MRAGAGKDIAKLESRIAKVKDEKQGPPSPCPLPSPRAREKRATIALSLATSRGAALIQFGVGVYIL